MRPKISQSHPLSLKALDAFEVNQIIKVSNRFMDSVTPAMTLGFKVSSLASTALNGSTVFTNIDADSILNIQFYEGTVFFSIFDHWGIIRDIMLDDANIILMGDSSALALDDDSLESDSAIIRNKAYKAAGIVIRLYSEATYMPTDKEHKPYDNTTKSETLNDTKYKIISAFKNWNVKDIPKTPFSVRGHYRLQPCGAGRKEIKKIFVKEHVKNQS